MGRVVSFTRCFRGVKTTLPPCGFIFAGSESTVPCSMGMPSAAVRAAPGALVLLSGKRSSVCLQSSTYPPCTPARSERQRRVNPPRQRSERHSGPPKGALSPSVSPDSLLGAPPEGGQTACNTPSQRQPKPRRTWTVGAFTSRSGRRHERERGCSHDSYLVSAPFAPPHCFIHSHVDSS
jgi:hypothetical protein